MLLFCPYREGSSQMRVFWSVSGKKGKGWSIAKVTFLTVFFFKFPQLKAFVQEGAVFWDSVT